MLPAAEERTPALTSVEEIFSLAAGVALAALDMHQGAREAQGKKPHQGIFSKKRALRVSPMWAKWSGTHQDRKCSWSETVSGSALDANGNTLSDPSGKSYTWDFENRLTQTVVPGANGGTTSFKYDPFGRRIQKSGPLGTTNYLYDVIDGDANLIEEMDSAGNLLARYNHELEADTPLSMFRSGTASYYERDGLGSVTSLSNSAGALVNTYTYDSFGKLTASTGTLTNPFQYTAREFDPETGLYEYRARYYDQSVGRFNSEDPIRFKGGIDFYRYVGNNPITRTDPDGMGAAACAKALANLAKAYAVVDARLAAFIAHGDMDPGHAKALGQAVNRLNNAIDDVKKNCDCDLLKAEAAAAVAAATALATQVGDTIQQFCSEEPEVCFAF